MVEFQGKFNILFGERRIAHVEMDEGPIVECHRTAGFRFDVLVDGSQSIVIFSLVEENGGQLVFIVSMDVHDSKKIFLTLKIPNKNKCFFSYL